MDGEWEPPQINNPKYKGEWKPRQLKILLTKVFGFTQKFLIPNIHPMIICIDSPIWAL